MSQKRTSSKVKQKYYDHNKRQIETRMLEDETKRMEEKLAALKLQVEEQKKLKETMVSETTLSKWRRTTNSDAPLKDYAKKVLADRKEALNKYGVNEKKIINAKSFEPALTKMRQERKEIEEKDLTKLPKFEITRIIESKKDILTSEIPVRSIKDNFMKAKMNVKELIHRKTLEEFIEENYLNQYLPILKENHIVELEDLYHLTKERMNALGILPGHQTKIMKRIKEELEGRKVTNANESERNETEVMKGEKVSFGYGDGDVNEYREINEKEEDSKQNKNEGKFIKNENYEESHREDYEENEGQSENDESEYEDEVILTAPQMTEFSIQTYEDEDKKIDSLTYNCFQCYKKCNDKEHESSDGRIFCSEACLAKYLQFMQKKCPECEQTFYKFNGYFNEGLWFCSIKCSPNRESIEEMFINWSLNRPE